MNIKPQNGIPWKRIIMEHLLDGFIGFLFGSFLMGLFHVEFIALIASWGGFAGLVSILTLIQRIYGGKNGKDKQ